MNDICNRCIVPAFDGAFVPQQWKDAMGGQNGALSGRAMMLAFHEKRIHLMCSIEAAAWLAIRPRASGILTNQTPQAACIPQFIAC
jgi:hypothetical protein